MSTTESITGDQNHAIHSVLCSTDFAEGSDVALTHALAIALAAGAELEVLHAEPENVQVSGQHFPDVLTTLVAWNVLPPGSKADVLPHVGLNLKRLIRVGEPAATSILEEITATSSQLLVMATHGRTGVERWRQPSVTEAVTRLSRVPTLVIPPNAPGFVDMETGALSLRRVLVPVDHTPSPQTAVDAATRMVRLLNIHDAWICTLYVGDRALAPAVEFNEPRNGRERKWTQDGPVVEGIISTARQWSADLIVMATEGRVGLLDALRGSTVERLLRFATCPVLVVPSPAPG